MEIRSCAQIHRRFARRASAGALDDIFDELFALRRLYLEGGRCLSLAVAADRRSAAERIRRARQDEAHDQRPPAAKRLPIAS